MRFLISRFSSMGDVICTLPVAAALKAGHSDCEVAWIVDRRFASIVERCRAVDQVIVAEKQFGNLKEQVRGLGEFDAALDMQGLLKSAIPVGLARAKTRLGYHWQREFSSLFSQAVKPDPSSIHIVDQYLDVARAAGGEAGFAEFALEPTPADIKNVEAKVEGEGPLVVMNGGAGWASKRWPAENFAKVADRLMNEGARVAFIGGPDGQEAFQEIQSHAQCRPIDLIGRTSLGELIALISQSVMHLGGDTGSTHLAAALKKPAFGLYLLTRPERSCPYGQIHRCHSLDPAVEADSMMQELKGC